MDYKDAIEYLRANDIKKEDDTFYEFGDVCWTAHVNTSYTVQRMLLESSNI